MQGIALHALVITLIAKAAFHPRSRLVRDDALWCIRPKSQHSELANVPCFPANFPVWRQK